MKQEITIDKDGTPMINLENMTFPKFVKEVIKVGKIITWLNDIFGVKFYEDEEARE